MPAPSRQHTRPTWPSLTLQIYATAPAPGPDIDATRSMEEDGLYDYVIVNDELDKAFEELSMIAERALAGEIGAAPEHLQARPGWQSMQSLRGQSLV